MLAIVQAPIKPKYALMSSFVLVRIARHSASVADSLRSNRSLTSVRLLCVACPVTLRPANSSGEQLTTVSSDYSDRLP